MTYSLFDTPRRAFALRPDIVLEFGKHKVVMDTKWKLLGLRIYGTVSSAVPSSAGPEDAFMRARLED
ncbi:MAG: hypothetical protein KBI09_07175 [Mesotoga sp.]|jgi:hypothetical protein|nr:hypothetical protein [Mesotoga sp.]